jgi:hypothetical protein
MENAVAGLKTCSPAVTRTRIAIPRTDKKQILTGDVSVAVLARRMTAAGMSQARLCFAV